MKITDVRFTKLNAGNLKAFANVTFDNALVVKGFKIIQGGQGLFTSWPQTKAKDEEKWYDDVFPTTGELRTEVQTELIAKYNSFVGNAEANDTAEDDDLPF